MTFYKKVGLYLREGMFHMFLPLLDASCRKLNFSHTLTCIKCPLLVPEVSVPFLAYFSLICYLSKDWVH